MLSFNIFFIMLALTFALLTKKKWLSSLYTMTLVVIWMALAWHFGESLPAQLTNTLLEKGMKIGESYDEMLKYLKPHTFNSMCWSFDQVNGWVKGFAGQKNGWVKVFAGDDV